MEHHLSQALAAAVALAAALAQAATSPDKIVDLGGVLQVTEVAPVRVEARGNVLFADFGNDAYGNLKIHFPSAPPAGELTVRLGEKLTDRGAIDRRPPGSVNYRELHCPPGKGNASTAWRSPRSRFTRGKRPSSHRRQSAS